MREPAMWIDEISAPPESKVWTAMPPKGRRTVWFNAVVPPSKTTAFVYRAEQRLYLTQMLEPDPKRFEMIDLRRDRCTTRPPIWVAQGETITVEIRNRWRRPLLATLAMFFDVDPDPMPISPSIRR